MKKKTSSVVKKLRYKNDLFLKSLGRHCQKLRIQNGYSIDRMSKEGESLSPSVIHRLEIGNGAVTVAAIYRFAKVLDVHPKVLFDFPVSFDEGETAIPEDLNKIKILSEKEVLSKRLDYRSYLPLYSIKAAAGYFGSGENVRKEGWIEVASGTRLDSHMFVVKAVGHSMEPRIQNGEYIVFKGNPTGTRQGKIVLVQYRGAADPETGGAFTVKMYSSSKVYGKDGSWRHQQIVLSPVNPDYEPIILNPTHENDFKIIGEYLFTI